MGGDLITSPAQRVGVIDRSCCQIPTHPHPVPQGGIVGQTIDRHITADHQPIVSYLKLGRTLHRILLVSIPDPFLPVSISKKKKRSG